ncbi:MAG: hypothetical protein H7A37_00230 [Chlamydiales bacterium]|nr:hypothetical protein [Chlamydiia bacterium]MCP5506721.1 hypothetical protein [Chlamydiales bacterium]
MSVIESPKHSQTLAPFRSLWIDSDSEVTISECLTISLPQRFAVDAICEWMEVYGFRQLIVGGVLKNTGSMGSLSFIDELQERGVFVVWAPTLTGEYSYCPYDQKYRNQLLETLAALPDSCTALFWEGKQACPQYFLHPAARDATDEDLARAEVQLLEEAAGGRRLCYQLAGDSADQVAWFHSLCNDIGSTTTLLFSQEGATKQPFWGLLAEEAAPLAAVVRLEAGVSIGEELFAEHAEHLGVVAKVAALPKEGGLLDMHLRCYRELFSGNHHLRRLFFDALEERFPGSEWLLQRLMLIDHDQRMRDRCDSLESQRMYGESIKVNKALASQWIEGCGSPILKEEFRHLLA